MTITEKTICIEPTIQAFGPFVFLKKIASGGMAEIFLARPASSRGNGRVLVVKRILPHVASNPMFVQMFQTEIQTIMGFNHPHTVQLHDFGEVDGQHFISMEYIDGKNLKEVINKFRSRNQSLPIPMILSLISQAAVGLNYAHTFVNNVTGTKVHAIHRDISPQNLLVSYDGNLKVIDFGVAKVANSIPSWNQDRTRVGTLKGKVAYMSPEQVSGRVMDSRSDIFALGLVAWELLTFRRPFGQLIESEMELIDRIKDCDRHILPPSTFNSEVSAELDEIIMKCLRKNPNDRFQTAMDFQIAIREFLVKQFPNYTYAETGRILKQAFEGDRQLDHLELKKLNDEAQSLLSSYSSNEGEDTYHPGLVTGVFKGLKAIVPHSERLELRLKNIESLMKQKATGRHYTMIIVYVLTLVALKLEGPYNLFNLLLGDPAAVAADTGTFLFDNKRKQETPRRGPSAAVKKGIAKPISKTSSQGNKAKKSLLSASAIETAADRK